MDISQVTWRKSTYSGANGGECIEVGSAPVVPIFVRDSKATDGPRLAVTPHEWQSFTRRVKKGMLDTDGNVARIQHEQATLSARRPL